MMEFECEHNLSIENFLKTKSEIILDDCYVIQVIKPYKGIPESTNQDCTFDWLKVVLSMLLSFGIFRNNVYCQPFVRRFHISSAIIKFWILTSLILGLLIWYWTNNAIWGLLAIAAISMLSYGGVQMLDYESKCLRYYYYKKDASGIWVMSSVSEIYGMFSRRLIDYIFPFLYFGKRISFLNQLVNCKESITASEIHLDKYLSNVMNDSEQVYVYMEKNFYRVES